MDIKKKKKRTIRVIKSKMKIKLKHAQLQHSFIGSYPPVYPVNPINS